MEKVIQSQTGRKIYSKCSSCDASIEFNEKEKGVFLKKCAVCFLLIQD